MAVHEPCDILLAISKQFYYRSKNKLLINSIFAIFAISWIYWRLFVVGWILYQVWDNATFMIYDHIRHGRNLLHVMWAMHFIWFMKIVRALLRAVYGKRLPDARHDGFNGRTCVKEE